MISEDLFEAVLNSTVRIKMMFSACDMHIPRLWLKQQNPKYRYYLSSLIVVVSTIVIGILIALLAYYY